MNDSGEQAKPIALPTRLLRFQADRDPNTDPETARRIHAQAVPGALYAEAMRPLLEGLFADQDLMQSAMEYIQGLVKGMAPRDHAEEMLVVQMALTHVRSLRLTSQLNRETTTDGLRILSEYADRASNTFRRLMLALAEYRRPPRPPAGVTAIQQANFGAQQVVVNGPLDVRERATNEQGPRTDDRPREQQEALPPEPKGTGVPASVSAPREAVGVVHRAQDCGGQGPEQSERLAARREVPGG